jgi:hypothetical protein
MPRPISPFWRALEHSRELGDLELQPAQTGQSWASGDLPAARLPARCCLLLCAALLLLWILQDPDVPLQRLEDLPRPGSALHPRRRPGVQQLQTAVQEAQTHCFAVGSN